MRHLALALLPALAIAAPASASAAEVFGGLYAHAVKTPLSLDANLESGVDVQLGYRGGGLLGTRIQPYAFGALNTNGDTSYAAAGLSYKFGDRLFIRPGIGLAIHTGSTADHEVPDRIALGSRILFEPELGIGLRLAPRLTAEASWVHMSHAQLFGGQNPGIDNVGARISFAL